MTEGTTKSPLNPMSKKVIIVGGGFAGLNAAKAISQMKEFEITLIDQKNHHLFQPLLYQVASAALNPADIAVPIRSVVGSKKNVQVVLGKVENVSLQKKALILEGKEWGFDYLILACGATHSYFGHNEWENFAPGLKSLEQATEIRRRIFLALELAEKESDLLRKKALQTFVVIGGGPTGVELAGALGEITRYNLSKDFKTIDPKHTRILLIEAGPRILPSFAPALSETATKNLESLGVSVLVNTRVTAVLKNGVQLGPEFVETSCAIWAAGVRASDIGEKLGVALDPSGRVLVNSDLSVPKHRNVFVLGDQAHFKVGETNKALPGLAPVAIQQGKFMAKVLLADLKNRPRPAFEYVDKGQMATIGRKKAVAESGGYSFRGLTAWLMWLFVHIYYLIGFKNRLLVFIQWAWSYVTFQRGARLIINKEWRSFKD